MNTADFVKSIAPGVRGESWKALPVTGDYTGYANEYGDRVSFHPGTTPLRVVVREVQP